MHDFISANASQWQELEQLVRKAGKTHIIRRMQAEDLHRLDVLYRRVTIQLSQVTTRTEDPALAGYLNRLATSAHSVIYISKQRSLPGTVLDFLLEGFSGAVARTLPCHLLACFLFVMSALVGYHVSMHDPMAGYAILPREEVRNFGSTQQQLLESLHDGRDTTNARKFAFASFLFDNNLAVGIRSAATGIMAGIPTIYFISSNGLHLGAFSAVHHSKDIHAEYWAWILPHGITEILAIVLCGGVGLGLGFAVINPGFTSRGRKLRQVGREAVRIMGGAGLMFVLAAVIESYLRQSHLSNAARFLFAACSALFWLAYFGVGLLREREQARQQAWMQELELSGNEP